LRAYLFIDAQKSSLVHAQNRQPLEKAPAKGEVLQYAESHIALKALHQSGLKRGPQKA
jgi:hypothetical protein